MSVPSCDLYIVHERHAKQHSVKKENHKWKSLDEIRVSLAKEFCFKSSLVKCINFLVLSLNESMSNQCPTEEVAYIC